MGSVRGSVKVIVLMELWVVAFRVRVSVRVGVRISVRVRFSLWAYSPSLSDMTASTLNSNPDSNPYLWVSHGLHSNTLSYSKLYLNL
jgi:hypothetical protein